VPPVPEDELVVDGPCWFEDALQPHQLAAVPAAARDRRMGRPILAK
jgi:hypothetical protein